MIKEFILKALFIFLSLLSTINILDIGRMLIGKADNDLIFALCWGTGTKVSKSVLFFFVGVSDNYHQGG